MTENMDIANVAVNDAEKVISSDNGISDELLELKKEIILMENNENQEIEIKKAEKLEETNNDTGSLLKQLDDELDEIDDPNDDPIQSLLEEAQLLEEHLTEQEVASSDQEKSNLETNAQSTEKVIDAANEDKKENDVSNEDIDDGDLKIIDENQSMLEQNSEEKKAENDTDISKVIHTEPQMEVEENKKEQETTVTKIDETIVLESDEEEGVHNRTDITVINKSLSSSKRASVDDDLIDDEEPPTKRTRSSTPNDIQSKMILEDAEERNDKTVDENLLVVASGNRRRSETDIEIKQVEKRAGSPIEEYCDSLRQIKISRAESVEDKKMYTDKPEESQSGNEISVQENGNTSEDTVVTKEEKAETKTEPLIIKDIELDPKPEEPIETEEKQSPLSIEFLKTFKKSFNLMNRSNLEDFVLQKVVEAIINKSEISELRQKNETQEKIIANQRQRINDLAKQFRDLEMVHNRVTKDLETKSTGLVTPVKITRAVGLQVSQPRPKTDFRPMCSQPNQRVPPFPSRSPQRPNNQMNNMNAMQPGQRMNMSLRQGMQQNNSAQFPQSKTSLVRPIGQVANNTQAKMIAMQKQQAMQRQQSILQHPRNHPPVLQRSNTGAGRSSVSLGAPGPHQRSPTVLNSLLSNQQSRGSPVVLRKIIRPGPASVQQAQMQAMSQQQKSSQNKFIDLTDEEEAARSPTQSNNMTATKIHVKSPATLNSSVTAPNFGNGLNRSANALNSNIANKLPVQRTSVQIAPKVAQNASQAQLIRRQVVSTVNQKRMHPAPLPILVSKDYNPGWKRPPPRPQIRINNIDAGIVISWTIHEPRLSEDFDSIVKYQIYAYQETNQPPATESWRHVGDVKAMALPMAVTLTQFQEGQRYHFAVRAVDEHERAGTFSVPRTWDEKT